MEGEVQLILAAQQALSTIPMAQDLGKSPFAGDAVRILSEQNNFHESTNNMTSHRLSGVNGGVQSIENLQQPIATELPSDQENIFSSVRTKKRKRGCDVMYPALSNGQGDGNMSPSSSSMVTVLKFKNGEFVEVPSSVPNYNSPMSLKDMRKAITSSLENCLMEPEVQSQPKPTSQRNSPPKQTSPKRTSPKAVSTKQASPKAKEASIKRVPVEQSKAPEKAPVSTPPPTLPPQPRPQQLTLPQCVAPADKPVTTKKQTGPKPKKPKSPDAESIKFANRQRELMKLKKEMRQKIKMEGHDSELAKQALGDWARTVGVSCTMCGKHVQKSYGCFRRENAPEKLKYLFTPGMNRIKICRRCLPYKKQTPNNGEEPVKKGPKKGPAKKAGNLEKPMGEKQPVSLGQGAMNQEKPVHTATMQAIQNKLTSTTAPQLPFSTTPQGPHMSLGSHSVPQGCHTHFSTSSITQEPQLSINTTNVPHGTHMSFNQPSVPHELVRFNTPGISQGQQMSMNTSVPQAPQPSFNSPSAPQAPPMTLNIAKEPQRPQMSLNISGVCKGQQFLLNTSDIPQESQIPYNPPDNIPQGQQMSISAANISQVNKNAPQQQMLQSNTNAIEYFKMLAGNVQMNTNKDGTTSNMPTENQVLPPTPQLLTPLSPGTDMPFSPTNLSTCNTVNPTTNHNVSLNVPSSLANNQTLRLPPATSIPAAASILQPTGATTLPPNTSQYAQSPVTPVTNAPSTTGTNPQTGDTTTMLTPPWTPLVGKKEESLPSMNNQSSGNAVPYPINKPPSAIVPPKATKQLSTTKPTKTIQKLSALATGNVSSIPAAIVVSSQNKKAGQVMLQIQPVKLVRQLPKNQENKAGTNLDTNAKPGKEIVVSPAASVESLGNPVNCAGCNTDVVNPYSITKPVAPAKLQHLFSNDCEVLRVCGKCLCETTVGHQPAVGMVSTADEKNGGETYSSIGNAVQEQESIGIAGYFEGTGGDDIEPIVNQGVIHVDQPGVLAAQVESSEEQKEIPRSQDVAPLVAMGSNQNVDEISSGEGIDKTSENECDTVVMERILGDSDVSKGNTAHDLPTGTEHGDSIGPDCKDLKEVGLMQGGSRGSVDATGGKMVVSGLGPIVSSGGDGDNGGLLVNTRDTGEHANYGSGTVSGELVNAGDLWNSVDDVEAKACTEGSVEGVVTPANEIGGQDPAQKCLVTTEAMVTGGNREISQESSYDLPKEMVLSAEGLEQHKSETTVLNNKEKSIENDIHPVVPQNSTHGEILEGNDSVEEKPKRKSTMADRCSKKQNDESKLYGEKSSADVNTPEEKSRVKLPPRESPGKDEEKRSRPGRKPVGSPKREPAKNKIVAKTHQTRGATLKNLKELETAKEASLSGKRKAKERSCRGKRAKVEESGTTKGGIDERSETPRGSPSKRTKTR